MSDCATTDRVREILEALNDDLEEEEASIFAFLVEEDADFEGQVAHVVWSVKSRKTADNMALIDKYCEIASDKLAQTVQFTYCRFRDDDELVEVEPRYRRLGSGIIA